MYMTIIDLTTDSTSDDDSTNLISNDQNSVVICFRVNSRKTQILISIIEKNYVANVF